MVSSLQLIKNKRKQLRGLMRQLGEQEARLRGGGPATYDDHRETMRERSVDASRSGREIAAIDFTAINWEERQACQDDLERFGRFYMPAVFNKPPSRNHRRCIDKMQRVTFEGGSFALAMERGGGKTAWCRAAIAWAISYGHRRFPVFLGANDAKALETLSAVKTLAIRSPDLGRDFPEVYHAIQALKADRGHLTRGQLYRGEPTWILWGSDNVRFPSLLLTKEDAAVYSDHGYEFTPIGERFIARSAGSLIYAMGIGGAIRGAAIMHPVTLEQMRPDLALVDDVQKDQGADSPTTCDKIITLIDGAIQGLAGPGEQLAVMMPCTVIREGDVSDTYLDRVKKPEYQGERCQMVISWPAGITDHEIGTETEPARLWNQYGELRRDSLQQFGDIRLATAHYKANRAAMDEDFVVSWPERFSGDKKHGRNRELSAQQHAMNLRFKSPETFPAEYQNRPRSIDQGMPVITAAALAERINSLARRECPADTHCVVTFIDVQNEVLLSATLAVNQGFTGGFVDYGTWPEVNSRYFARSQTEGWGLLTREFFGAYPDQRGKAERTAGGKLRAPLEAKIYHAVRTYIELLLTREYARADMEGTPLKNIKIGVDGRWGKTADVVKRVVRDIRRPEVVMCLGFPISPSHKQYEEYQRTEGWLFEDHVHPGLKEVKWIWRPGEDHFYHLSTDVNRLKTFLFSRLGCPVGARGAITLFKSPPMQHEMFADQVAASEYPEPVSARGRTKDMWQQRDGRPDNDWLDCAAGCMALASLAGARLQLDPDQARMQAPKAKRPKLRDLWRLKRGR